MGLMWEGRQHTHYTYCTVKDYYTEIEGLEYFDYTEDRGQRIKPNILKW